MTRHYRGLPENNGGEPPIVPVSYTTLIPPGWQGFCCHCRRRLTVADWQAAQIVAAGDGNPWHCVCLAHMKAGEQEYRDALRDLASALVGA
jgi:hypothetical protein